MTFWQFMRGIELRDVRTARTRAWMRFCHLSIGALVATILWDAFHPHDFIDSNSLLIGILMVMVIAAAGAVYDFWRVRHPEKTSRYEWLRVGMVSIIAGVVFAFLILWIVTR